MRRSPFVLSLETATSGVGCVRASCLRDGEVEAAERAGSQATDEHAAAAATLLRELGWKSEPLILVLSSRECLSARVEIRDLPERGRERLLLYRLEEKLPLTAEEVAVDFVTCDECAVGVAVEAERWAEFLAQLEARGIFVEQIVPAAFLTLCGEQSVNDRSEFTGAVVSSGGDSADVFAFNTGRLIAWRHLVGELEEALKVTLRQLALEAEAPRGSDGEVRRSQSNGDHTDSSYRVRFFDPPEGVTAALGDLPEIAVETDAADSRQKTLLSGAARSLARGVPWALNLRRGPLAPADPFRRARLPARVAALAALVFVVCLNVALIVRARAYDTAATSARDRVAQVYRTAFPDEASRSLPTSVERRMESRARELEGLRGVAASPEKRPPSMERVSALSALVDVTNGLRGDVRFALFALRIEGENVSLRGRTRSHGDADRLATSLRQEGRLAVDPPVTEILQAQGVGFALAAKRVHAASEGESAHLFPTRETREQPRGGGHP